MQRDQKRRLFDFINSRQKTLNGVDESVASMALREKDLQTDLEGLESMTESIWNAYIGRRPQEVTAKQNLRKMLRELQLVKQSLLNLIRANETELQRLRRSKRRLELEVMWKKLRAGIPPSEVGFPGGRQGGLGAPATPCTTSSSTSSSSSSSSSSGGSACTSSRLGLPRPPSLDESESECEPDSEPDTPGSDLGPNTCATS